MKIVDERKTNKFKDIAFNNFKIGDTFYADAPNGDGRFLFLKSYSSIVNLDNPKSTYGNFNRDSCIFKNVEYVEIEIHVK